VLWRRGDSPHPALSHRERGLAAGIPSPRGRGFYQGKGFSEIDALVYDLYDLTEEEIAIVEG
jgi:hypothetical protein